MSTRNKQTESFKFLRAVATSMARRWNNDELSVLCNGYSSIPNEVLVNRLDRTKQAIKSKASVEGLSKDSRLVTRWKIVNSELKEPGCNYFGNYIRGFTDGEGSFNYTQTKSGSVEFRYAIELAQSDEEILKKIKNFFGVGVLSKYAQSNENWEDKAQYAVYSSVELANVIIPFFVSNPPIADNKRKQFVEFCKSFAEYFDLDPETVKWVDHLQEIVVEN